MSFDPIDVLALSDAENAGYSYAIEQVDTERVVLIRIILPRVEGVGEGRRLARYLEAIERFHNNCGEMTYWIDVVTEDVPDYIREAFVRLVGYGVSAIVTHKGMTSHDAGHPLGVLLSTTIREASGHNQIWHPFRKELVQARPQQLQAVVSRP